MLSLYAAPSHADPPYYSSYKEMLWNGDTRVLDWTRLRLKQRDVVEQRDRAIRSGNDRVREEMDLRLAALTRIEGNLGPASTVRAPADLPPPPRTPPEDDRPTPVREPSPSPAAEDRRPTERPTDRPETRATDRAEARPTDRPEAVPTATRAASETTDRADDTPKRDSKSSLAGSTPAPTATPRFAVDPFPFDEKDLSDALRPRPTPAVRPGVAKDALSPGDGHGDLSTSVGSLLEAAKQSALAGAAPAKDGLAPADLEKALEAFREAQSAITKMEDAEESTPARQRSQQRAAVALRRLATFLPSDLKGLVDEKLAEVEEVTWDVPQLAAVGAGAPDKKADPQLSGVSDGLGKALAGLNEPDDSPDDGAFGGLLATVRSQGGGMGSKTGGAIAGFGGAPMLAGFLSSLTALPLGPLFKKALKRLAKVSADAVGHLAGEAVSKARPARFQMPRQLSRLLTQLRAPASTESDEVTPAEWLWLTLLAAPGLLAPFAGGVAFALWYARRRRGGAA